MSKRRNTLPTVRGDPALAQYFTPRPVAAFLWQAVRMYAGTRLGAAARIIDPAAGTGIFLEVVVEEGRLSPANIYGVEIDPTLDRWRAPVIQNTCFYWGDGLLGIFPELAPASFNAVIGNPPFGRLADVMPHSLGREEWSRFAIWQGRITGANGQNLEPRIGRCPIELLFLERALHLVEPGGMVGLILPEGFFANSRLQWARDWVRTQAQVRGVVFLPAAVFRGPRLNARAGVVFLQRQDGRNVRGKTLLWRPMANGRQVLEDYFQQALQAIRLAVGATRNLARSDGHAAGVLVPEERLGGARWDPGYWLGKRSRMAADRRFPRVCLGEFIEHLTYGPIVTGCRPRNVNQGIRVIRQGDFTQTGLRLQGFLRVEAGGVFDPQRSRVQQRDWLLPRSGAGALGRNRMAVYVDPEPANVGCFVDLVRLIDLNPFYAWLFFKSQPGWQQLQAVINGVGTPNINFTEIRSLRIAVAPLPEQEEWEERYFGEIWPLHCRQAESEAVQQEAVQRFQRLIWDFEGFLAGRRGSAGR